MFWFKKETFIETYVDQNRSLVKEEFEIYFQDFFSIIKEQVKDCSLASIANQYPTCKYMRLVEEDEEVEILDDIETGSDRWKDQVHTISDNISELIL